MKVVANTRNEQGTGASRRLRHTGKVPGILYGGKAEPQPIEVDHNNLFHALRKEKFHASILDMELDGKNERVLLRSFHCITKIAPKPTQIAITKPPMRGSQTAFRARFLSSNTQPTKSTSPPRMTDMVRILVSTPAVDRGE